MTKHVRRVRVSKLTLEHLNRHDHDINTLGEDHTGTLWSGKVWIDTPADRFIEFGCLGNVDDREVDEDHAWCHFE